MQIWVFVQTGGGLLLLNCSMIVIGLTFLYTCICEWLAEDIILVLV